MYQQLILVGNLGKDPQMSYTPSGQAVTSFSMATSRKYTKDNSTVEETTWFRVSVWGKQAEACNTYLRKGSKVLVEGRLQADPATLGPRTFTRKDGTTGATFEVTAETVRFLDSKLSGETQAQVTAGDDEIPF